MSTDLAALVERWDGFLSKVEARSQQIMAEAEAGFDQIIAINVIDTAPLAGAVSAFDARMHGLGRKIMDAWDKLDVQLRSGKALDLRDGLYDKGEALQERIDVSREELTIRKLGLAARRLQALAAEEAAKQRECPNCGGALEIARPHAPSSVTCAFCGAVSSVQPGPAASSFYFGAGIHSLARESALPQWHAMKRAEREYNDIRGPSASDLQRLETVTEAYWRAYCTACGQLHPDWDADQVEREIRGKMGGFRTQHEGLR